MDSTDNSSDTKEMSVSEEENCSDDSTSAAAVSMETSTLKKVADAIACIFTNTKHSFYAEGTMDLSDVSISVGSIGDLTLPITRQCAEKLKEIAILAKYGHKEKTLLDTNVRNTYTISSDKLNVNIGNLEQVMQELRSSLELPNDCILKPHLYNLLVYEPGQFFKFHQDSEKLENMVATMVISLPSPHIGGDLVIEHIGATHKFSTQNIESNLVKYIAFYADCRHKVNKVEDGHRIVLTYNLVLKNNDAERNYSLNAKLFESLKLFFDVNESGEDDKTSSDEQHLLKFVYLLDHKYTKHGLKWSTLKGTDKLIALNLVNIAKQLDCELYLAQANVIETWTACDDVINAYTVFETCEEYSAELSELQPYNDSSIKFSEMSVESNELCWTKGNSNLKPYNKSQEFTGNEGCTEERWYRRGALALIPRSNYLALQFQFNRSQTIKQMNELVQKPNNQGTVINMLREARKTVLKEVYRLENSEDSSFLQAAIYAGSEEVAFSVFKALFNKILKRKYCRFFVEALSVYGPQMFHELLDSTKIAEEIVSEEVLALGRDCIDSKNDLAIGLGKEIIDRQMKAFLKPEKLRYGSDLTHVLLKTCLWIGDDCKIDKIIESIKGKPYTVEDAAKIYITCKKPLQDEMELSEGQLSKLDALKFSVIDNIKLEVEKCKQKANIKNWFVSIYKNKCNCDDCGKIKLFLNSSVDSSVLFNFTTVAKLKHAQRGVTDPRLDVTVTSIPKKMHQLKIVKKINVVEEAARPATRQLQKLQQLLYQIENQLPCKRKNTDVESEPSASKQNKI